jgi:hypothetical protein
MYPLFPCHGKTSRGHDTNLLQLSGMATFVKNSEPLWAAQHDLAQGLSPSTLMSAHPRLGERPHDDSEPSGELRPP